MSIVTSSRWQAKEYTKPWAISKLPAHFFPTRIKHEANSCTRYLRRSLATVLGCPKALVSDQIDSSPRFVYTQCSILHFITPLLPTSLPLCCVKVYKTDATGQSHLIRRLQQAPYKEVHHTGAQFLRNYSQPVQKACPKKEKATQEIISPPTL